MVDFDLEAPGMTHFFSEAINNRPKQVRWDALDLLLHAKKSLDASSREGIALSAPPESLADYVVPVLLPERTQPEKTRTSYADGRLDLLPATLQPAATESGEPSTDYLQRMDELNLPKIFSAGGHGHRFGNHVRDYFLGARFDAPGDVRFTMRETVRAAYDVVLIDSRTGLNEVSGLSVGPLCDALVICCGLNEQNIEGTRYFLERAGLFQPDRAKPYLLATGPVPLWHTKESEKRIAHLRGVLKTDKIVEIPYHPKAALQETVFVTEEPSDPISRAYDALSRAIVGQLSGKQTEIEELKALARNSVESPSHKVEVARAVAKRLTLLRLWPSEFRLEPSLCSFPSAYTISSLAQWSPDGERSRTSVDPAGIALSTAVAAHRLGSDVPFNRAWQLLADAEPQLKNLLAVRLLFFQLLVRQSFPNDAPGLEVVRTVLTNPQEERHPRVLSLVLDAYVTHLLSRKYAPKGTPALSFGAAQQHFDRMMVEPSLMWFRNTEFLSHSPHESLNLIPKAMMALTSRKIGKRERLQLAALLKILPAPPKVRSDLRGWGRQRERTAFLSRGLPYERGYWGEPTLPVGLWPELVLAASTAVVKGADAAHQVVDWLTLARLSYGYAWRVMIDWTHLESVKDEPVFKKFISEEDELVEQIESSIDGGVYPL